MIVYAGADGFGQTWIRADSEISGVVFVSTVVLFLTIFFDSCFNDACVHYLACGVQDDTLSEAQKIKTQRALRAANELREHDVACAVLQAGPTSLSRCAELAAREDAARAAVGTPGEAAAFASLLSLIGAEKRRIHR